MLTASPSHCGVEFVRALSDIPARRNFARLMAKETCVSTFFLMHKGLQGACRPGGLSEEPEHVRQECRRRTRITKNSANVFVNTTASPARVDAPEALLNAVPMESRERHHNHKEVRECLVASAAVAKRPTRAFERLGPTKPAGLFICKAAAANPFAPSHSPATTTRSNRGFELFPRVRLSKIVIQKSLRRLHPLHRNRNCKSKTSVIPRQPASPP